MTLVLYAVIAIAFAAALVALLVVVLPEDSMARPVRDVVPLGLPVDGPLRADDVNRLRLPVTLRGYRMVDTDAVLDRLGAELDDRDRRLADLQAAYQRATAREQYAAFAPAAGEQVLIDDDHLDLVAAPPAAGWPLPTEGVEPRAFETSSVEPPSVEPPSVEPNSVEPNSVEPNSVEPNSVEPNSVEPPSVEPASVEPGGDPKDRADRPA
jgi:hypothetical protein